MQIKREGDVKQSTGYSEKQGELKRETESECQLSDREKERKTEREREGAQKDSHQQLQMTMIERHGESGQG